LPLNRFLQRTGLTYVWLVVSCATLIGNGLAGAADSSVTRQTANKVVQEKYPAAHLIGVGEFDQEMSQWIKKNRRVNDPGLAVADFNGDGIEDFAALIRETGSKRYDPSTQFGSGKSYDYYEGALIICHGQASMKFNCSTLEAKPVMTIPYQVYISSAVKSPDCHFEGQCAQAALDQVHFEKAGSQHVYCGGKYRDCTTAD
jgi:hypothetical protein